MTVNQKSSYRSRSAAQVLETMDVEQVCGLSEQDASGRLDKHGSNKLREATFYLTI